MLYDVLTDMVCWTIVAFPSSKHFVGRKTWESPWMISEPLLDIVYDKDKPKTIITKTGESFKVVDGPHSLDLDGISFLCEEMDFRGLTAKEKNKVLVDIGAKPLFVE